MRKILILVIALTLLVPFIVSGCGGGGGGGSTTSVTPPGTNLVGTYRLTGFDLDYYDSNMNYIGRLTQADFSSWSGSMKFGASSISQIVVLEGFTVATNGTYSVTYTNATSEGVLHVVAQGLSYNVVFICSGNTLSTYAGIMYDSINNVFFEEYDHWEKTSDSLAVSNKTTQTNFYSESNKLMIGGIIGSIVE